VKHFAAKAPIRMGRFISSVKRRAKSLTSSSLPRIKELRGADIG
jgi:hypothetical protein